MKYFSPRNRGMVFSVMGVLAAVYSVNPSFADLVYDDEPQAAAPTADRESTREVIKSSRDARASMATESAVEDEPSSSATAGAMASPRMQSSQNVQVQVSDSASPDVDVATPLSKTELMRRKRLREELRNEDLLQERLEELRLRDEQRRTDQVFSNNTTPQAPSVTAPAVMAEETVSAPVTERPGQGSTAVAVAMTPTSTTSSSLEAIESSEEKARVKVMPRFGLSSMAGQTGYDVNSRYAAGLGLGFEASENVEFELGYMYSEYGVAANSSNPWVYTYNLTMRKTEGFTMKQNVVDAGLKFHLLGRDSRVRPYIGGGAAWSKSFINYDQGAIDYLNRSGMSNYAGDYELTSYLGFLSTGLDVKLSKSIAIGLGFKYYTVLASHENQNINNAALTGYYPGYYSSSYYGMPAYAAPDGDKNVLGGSLARSSFYSVLVGATFSF